MSKREGDVGQEKSLFRPALKEEAVNRPCAKDRQPHEEEQGKKVVLPILSQPTEHRDAFDPEPGDDAEVEYEAAEQMEWPRPAWGVVLLLIGLACWAASPQGFIPQRFLNSFFLWASAACALLGSIILIGRWLTGGVEIPPRRFGDGDLPRSRSTIASETSPTEDSPSDIDRSPDGT